MEPARDGGVIIDDNAMQVLFGKEHTLVISNCVGKYFVRNRRLCEAGSIKASQIMPVTSETVTATECTLSTKYGKRDLKALLTAAT